MLLEFLVCLEYLWQWSKNATNIMIPLSIVYSDTTHRQSYFTSQAWPSIVRFASLPFCSLFCSIVLFIISLGSVLWHCEGLFRNGRSWESPMRVIANVKNSMPEYIIAVINTVSGLPALWSCQSSWQRQIPQTGTVYHHQKSYPWEWDCRLWPQAQHRPEASASEAA